MGSENVKNAGTLVAAVSTGLNPESRESIKTHVVGVRDNGILFKSFLLVNHGFIMFVYVANQLVRGTMNSIGGCIGAICRADPQAFGQAAKEGIVNGVTTGLKIGRHAIGVVGEAAPLLEGAAIGFEAAGHSEVATGLNAVAGAGRLVNTGLGMAGLYEDDDQDEDEDFEFTFQKEEEDEGFWSSFDHDQDNEDDDD